MFSVPNSVSSVTLREGKNCPLGLSHLCDVSHWGTVPHTSKPKISVGKFWSFAISLYLCNRKWKYLGRHLYSRYCFSPSTAYRERFPQLQHLQSCLLAAHRPERYGLDAWHGRVSLGRIIFCPFHREMGGGKVGDATFKICNCDLSNLQKVVKS